MEKVAMSRINHHLPKALHKKIRDIAFDNDVSTTVAINEAIEGYIKSFGSDAKKETKPAKPKEPTSMDKFMAYQAMGLDERVEVNMVNSRETHELYNSGEGFDEDKYRGIWVDKITRELEQEALEAKS